MELGDYRRKIAHTTLSGPDPICWRNDWNKRLQKGKFSPLGWLSLLEDIDLILTLDLNHYHQLSGLQLAYSGSWSFLYGFYFSEKSKATKMRHCNGRNERKHFLKIRNYIFPCHPKDDRHCGTGFYKFLNYGSTQTQGQTKSYWVIRRSSFNRVVLQLLLKNS